jgi:hypothetical protein
MISFPPPQIEGDLARPRADGLRRNRSGGFHWPEGVCLIPTETDKYRDVVTKQCTSASGGFSLQEASYVSRGGEPHHTHQDGAGTRVAKDQGTAANGPANWGGSNPTCYLERRHQALGRCC